MDALTGFQIDADEEPPSALFEALAAEAREFEPALRLLSVIVTPPAAPEDGPFSSPGREATLVFCWEGLDGGFSAAVPLTWMRFHDLVRRHAAERAGPAPQVRPPAPSP